MDMQVICIEEPAFYELLDNLYLRLKKQYGIKQDKWISPEEAMQMLRIKSPATLQKLRDNGDIRFTKDTPTMLYDVESIHKYLEKKKPQILFRIWIIIKDLRKKNMR